RSRPCSGRRCSGQGSRLSLLSRHTGFRRDYSRNPYAGYESVSGTYFPVYHHDARLPAKTWMIGLSICRHHKAWTLDKLKKTGNPQISWRKHRLAISVNGDGIQIHDHASGKVLPVTRLYWFAWSAFHPNTELEK
ncbi:MAG: DUF3179 domain-containing (seleno)protein, partial [Mariprofundus sp.]